MSEALNIHTRLSKLPHKVALPIRELVVAEHLSEDDAHLILDAGDCAGEHHRLLGFAVGYRNLRGQAARQYAYMDNLRRILPLLRQHGVQRVSVAFDGSGDSGSLDDVYYDAPPEFDARMLRCERIVVSSQFDDGRWIRTAAIEEASVNEAIEHLTNDYLDETDVDWYDGDGGFGELVINAEEGTVFLEVNVRVVRSTTEFTVERDIVTGEEV